MKKILAVSIMAALSASVTAKPADKGPHGFNIASSDELITALDDGVQVIKLNNTILFECNDNKPVNVIGNGNQFIHARGDFTALEFTDCSTVNIEGVNFKGGNSPEDYNPNPDVMVGGHAILVQNGTDENLTVDIKNVTVKHFGDHGIYVTDCINDDCGDGNDGLGVGTAGSIEVNLFDVVVMDGGFGGQDADGVRVNERGAGDIDFMATAFAAKGYGADGVELDEAGEGDVKAFVTASSFIENGFYCLADGVFAYNNEDNKCNDDGDPDVDDAFDIDEADEGSIVATITNTYLGNNFDEGLDFDEAGDGDIELTVTNVDAIDNADEAVKASEEDAGDTIVTITDFQDLNSDDTNQDLQVEQEGAGKLEWEIFDSVFDDAKVLSDENAESKLYIEGSTFDAVKYEGAIDKDNITIVDSVYNEIEDDN